MAGHDDAERIAARGCARGARTAWIAGTPGELRVGDRFAEADAGDLTPDRSLERRTGRIERQREALPLAGEVLGQLPLCLPGEAGAGAAMPGPVQRGVMPLPHEIQSGEPPVGRNEKHAPMRCLQVLVVHRGSPIQGSSKGA